MKQFGLGMMTLALSAGAAFGGGIDRSGQGIGYIFEPGRYAEFSYGSVVPSLRATPDVFGNIAGKYALQAGAFKMDLNDKLSLGLGFDRPYGADVAYNFGLGAHLDSSSITMIGRYKINNALSLHGGLSSTTVGGWFNDSSRLITVAHDSDTGFLLGAAWEKPEIAARLALTYFSGTTHLDPATNSSINAPQAVNLDFQTGIAADTLLFGTVRWADWSNTVIQVGYPVVSYDKDVFTYSLGLGHKFTDTWSAAVTLGHEAAQGGTASALAPTDGSNSIGLAATYSMNNMKITLGARKVVLGDAVTGRPGATWTDNGATAFGVKVAFSF